MFDVSQITQLHAEMVRRWHAEAPVHELEGYLGLVWTEHRSNFELWHQEDAARNPDATDQQIAEVHRKIDRLNQARNDAIEALDDWLAEQLAYLGIVPCESARLNTETPGSAVDRLSIMSLRIYHYGEQLERDDATPSHISLVQNRLRLCRQQLIDLAQSLTELLEDIQSGARRHKTYRQMKMYNEPGLRGKG